MGQEASMGSRKKVSLTYQPCEQRSNQCYEKILREAGGRSKMCGKDIEDPGNVVFHGTGDPGSKVGGFDC